MAVRQRGGQRVGALGKPHSLQQCSRLNGSTGLGLKSLRWAQQQAAQALPGILALGDDEVVKQRQAFEQARALPSASQTESRTLVRGQPLD